MSSSAGRLRRRSTPGAVGIRFGARVSRYEAMSHAAQTAARRREPVTGARRRGRVRGAGERTAPWGWSHLLELLEVVAALDRAAEGAVGLLLLVLDLDLGVVERHVVDRLV